jgi:hypothetical protein
MQEIGLILVLVDGAMQVIAALRVGDDTGIVPGRDRLGAQAERVVEEGGELDLRLQSTSGLGVRSAWYSRRKYSKTRSQYSAEKLTVCSRIPSRSATARASARSSAAAQ